MNIPHLLIRSMDSRDCSFFNPPKHLFCDADGSSIVFHVLPSPDQEVILQLIKAGGGEVTDGENTKRTGVVTISSGSHNLDNINNVISSSYIYACSIYGKLIDVENFRFVPGYGSLEGKTTRKNETECPQEKDCGPDYEITRLSPEEVYLIIMYILKYENLWKEIEEKVCSGKSWKSTRRKFALWVLQKFYQVSPLENKTLCGTLLQEDKHESKNGSSEVIPIQTSAEDLDKEISNAMGNEKRIVMQHGMKEGRNTILNQKEKLLQHSSQNMVSLCEGSGNTSEVGRDISSCGSRRQDAGYTSLIVDDLVISESEELVVGSECREGNVHLNVSINDESEVIEKKYEVQKIKGKDENLNEDFHQEPSPNKKEPLKPMKAKKVMRTNYSAPCNVWLRKGYLSIKWGEKGKICTSTPLSGSANIHKSSHVAPKQNTSFHLSLYSFEEDMLLLNWLCHKRKRSLDPLTGNRIWKFMESRKVVPGRSWQSLKERFRRHIAPNLKDYPIPKEDLQKLSCELKEKASFNH